MFKSRKLLGGVMVAASAMMIGASGATAFTVDGNLSDWGVTVGDNNGSSFTPSVSLNGTAYSADGSSQTAYFLENTDDNAGHGVTVGPNQGGQDYDTEFMAANLTGNILSIAIVSGLRPDNGFANYGPGDMRIVTGAGAVFGIEMGGGAGGGAGGAITEGAAGSTYGMDGNGVTTSHTVAAGTQTAGSIWADATWINDPIAPATPTQFAINGGSTQIGTADYAFTRNSVTNQHSIIEMSFDVTDLLGAGGGTLDIFWGPTCGNDFMHLSLLVPVGDTDVPAPAAGGLFALGLMGLGMLRRRRAAK